MAPKVTFNPVAREIEVTLAPDGDGVIDLNVQVDVYSDGKEDWLATAELQKYRFPIEAVGGFNTAAGKQGTLYILKTPWRLRLYDADHELRLDGVLVAEDGTRVWLGPTTPRNIAVTSLVPNNVVSVVPPAAGTVAEAVWSLAVGSPTTGTFGALLKRTSDNVLGVIGRLFS